MKLLRLHFSVRTLVILVTLVCAYFGAWEATKRYDVGERLCVVESFLRRYSPCPFLICRDELDSQAPGFISSATPIKKSYATIRYYVWFFGPKFKLPFESESR